MTKSRWQSARALRKLFHLLQRRPVGRLKGFDWTIAASMAACIAALFSGWAAWETRNGAHETARATRAAVWLQLLTEYASPEMLASMKGLRTWQQKNPKSFATDFEKLLTKGNKTAKETELEKQLDQ